MICETTLLALTGSEQRLDFYHGYLAIKTSDGESANVNLDFRRPKSSYVKKMNHHPRPVVYQAGGNGGMVEWWNGGPG